MNFLDQIEKMRKKLTSNTDTEFSFDNITPDTDCDVTISRDDFADIIKPIIKELSEFLKSSLSLFNKGKSI